MNVAKPSREGSSLPAGLARATAPLADPSRQRVRAAIGRSKAAPASEDAREALVASVEAALFARLNTASARTLVLHLGVASERGLLSGDTPEARFAFFCECLSEADFAEALLAQHPALHARLKRLAALWERATLETLRRVEAAGDELYRGLLGGERSAWVGTQSLGDPHQGGRTVQRLKFEDGREAIYKPRPVDMERGFQDLVRWLNDEGLAPQLSPVEVLRNPGWGWAKVVEAGPCADVSGVGRYFRRQGVNLALAYVLGAVDLHFENVVASGEHPVMVDLETLFHPFPVAPGRRGASVVAGRALDDSVLRTLLLPVSVEEEPGEDGARRRTDPSALGYVGPVADMSYVSDGWEADGADSMRLGKVEAVMPAATCLPELDGERVPAQAFADEIVGGFCDAYEFLSRRRERLLADGGPLEGFREGLARLVIRPTAGYTRLLDRSWHPRLGESEGALVAWLEDRLEAMPPEPPPGPRRRRAEIAALLAGDVPYFTRTVGKTPGWQAARERIASLSPADQARQAWIARMTLTGFEQSLPAPALISPAKAPAAAQIEAAARALGERLCETAFRSGRGASWLFPNVESADRMAPATAGFDLYDGLAGIGLFLAGLSVRTGDARFEATARAAFHEALTIWRGMPHAQASIGGYDGAGGLAWALAVSGRLARRRGWLAAACEVIEAQAALAARDPMADLISGRAGFALAGLGVAELAGRPKLAEALKPVVASLARSELPAREAGLAHGLAGVGLVLARTGKRRRGLELIAADVETSRRVREGSEPPEVEHDGRRMLAWCRGGAGAALASVRLGAPLVQDTRELVEAMGEAFEDGGFGASLGYCHGTLGAMEILDGFASADIEGAGELAARVRRETITRVLDGDVCAETYHRVEAPGLMRGLAGTGWALLRELEPGRFASVLTLEVT